VSRHHALLIIVTLQSRATRCCASLAAALKAVVANKAQWALPDGQWGEFLAAVAAIDKEAAHEVMMTMMMMLLLCVDVDDDEYAAAAVDDDDV
jgi:hypothetical protein